MTLPTVLRFCLSAVGLAVAFVVGRPSPRTPTRGGTGRDSHWPPDVCFWGEWGATLARWGLTDGTLPPPASTAKAVRLAEKSAGTAAAPPMAAWPG